MGWPRRRPGECSSLHAGDGHLVILELQAANRLIAHVATATTERLVVTAERLWNIEGLTVARWLA